MFQLTTSRRGRPTVTVNTAEIIVFQLTTSRRGRPLVCLWKFLPLRFQLTTSRRGRRMWNDSRWHTTNVSTHDLTKRSTNTVNFITVLLMFQLTTSRRGRQQFLRKKFSFQNHFLCSLHIIYSYYINTIFFSTLFLAKSSFFLVRIL